MTLVEAVEMSNVNWGEYDRFYTCFFLFSLFEVCALQDIFFILIFFKFQKLNLRFFMVFFCVNQ